MDAIILSQGEVETRDTRETSRDKLLSVSGSLERPVRKEVSVDLGRNLLL